MTASEAATPAVRRHGWRRIEAAAGHKSGVWVLAAIAFADSSFLPIPPDLLLLPMALAQPRRVWRLSALCTFASVLGAVVGYAIGYELWSVIGQPLIAFYGYERNFAIYQDLIAAWGAWIVIGKGLTPIPFKIVAIGAGVASMNPLAFLAAALLGRALHFSMVAAAIALWGAKAVALVVRCHRWLLGLAVVLLLASMIVYFAR